MDKKQPKSNKNNINKEQFIQNLIEKNSEISLAKKVMDQTAKTQSSAITIDQGNYYKTSISS